MFLVEDVEQMVRFYQDVLGAKLSAVHPEAPPYEWASLELDKVELMFWEKRAARKECPDLVIPADLASFIAYIYVGEGMPSTSGSRAGSRSSWGRWTSSTGSGSSRFKTR
jgi:catechol 2,3-dioxygenase-like lactoylglutathione lyase family enzyme